MKRVLRESVGESEMPAESKVTEVGGYKMKWSLRKACFKHLYSNLKELNDRILTIPI